MTDPQVGVLMLAGFIVIIFLGFPIAFTLVALGVGFGYYAMGDNIFPLLVQRAFGVMSNDVLIAVPLFLFMGYMVERSNLLDRLFHSLQIVGEARPRIARGRDPRHLRAVRDRHRHRRRGRDPHGPARASRDAQGGLRHEALGGCGGGGRLPGHPHPAQHHADPLWRDGEHLRGAPLRGRLLPGLPARRALHHLRDRALGAQSQPRAEIARRSRPTFRSRRWSWLLATSFFPLAFLILGVLGAILFGLATPNEAASLGAAGSIILAIGYGQFSFSA